MPFPDLALCGLKALGALRALGARGAVGAIGAIGAIGGMALVARQAAAPLPGTVVTPTHLAFDDLLARLEQAVQAHGLLLIAKPSASRNAAARGVQIPGNAVILTFNSDFAVRLLKASVAAGFEAPLRLYVTENPDRTATVTYRTAASLFAPYAVPELDALAHEIDQLLAQVIANAADPAPANATTMPSSPAAE